MKARWIESEEHGSYQPLWEETIYCTITKYTCGNCDKKSPGNTAYPYCPYCGSEMENGRSDLKHGTNS